MVTGKTTTGFEFEVDPIVLRDMEVIELMADSQEDGTLLPKMLTAVLGKKQRNALYDHVRRDDGRVILDDVDKEMGEILDALNQDKTAKN